MVQMAPRGRKRCALLGYIQSWKRAEAARRERHKVCGGSRVFHEARTVPCAPTRARFGLNRNGSRGLSGSGRRPPHHFRPSEPVLPAKRTVTSHHARVSGAISFTQRSFADGLKDPAFDATSTRLADRLTMTCTRPQAERQILLATRAPFKHPWIIRLLARKPAKLVAVAVANKMARIAWAIMAKGGYYRAPELAAAA